MMLKTAYDQAVHELGGDDEGVIDLSLLPDPRAPDPELVARAQQYFDVGKVVQTFGTWAVTDYGVECLVTYYPIKKRDLFKGEPDYGWLRAMAHKSWVNLADFADCLAAARAYFYLSPEARRVRMGLRRVESEREAPPRVARGERDKMSSALRFKILKRDGYRCQICGAPASEKGIRLEVDHKIAISQGGKTEEANLWVLCFDCNRGKQAREL